jgi:hypothetical protein
MGFFKRLCLFVFGLAGLLALAALVLPWYGPWTQEATALLGTREYFVAVEVVVAITAFGLLTCLLRSIFVRNRKTVVVAKADGDQITVSIDAIASQATHVIEEDGLFTARRVRVRAKKHGHVRLFARVQPASTVDVIAAAAELHDRLVSGLGVIVGDNVDKVELEFVDAVEYTPAEKDGALLLDGVEGFAETAGAAVTPNTATAADAAAMSNTAARATSGTANAPSDTSEITVPMARYAADRADEASTMGEE